MTYTEIEFSQLARKKKLYLFSSGINCRARLPELQSQYKVWGILDNDKGKHGTEIEAVPVLGLADVATYKQDVVVLITSGRYLAAIARQVLEAGIREIFFYDNTAHIKSCILRFTEEMQWNDSDADKLDEIIVKERILAEITEDSVDSSEYEVKYNNLKNKYEKIVIYKMDFSRVPWQCLYMMLLQDKILSNKAIFPVLCSLSTMDGIPAANEFLHQKMRETIAVMDTSNIGFYQYILIEHSEFIQFENKFVLPQNFQEFNSYQEEMEVKQLVKENGYLEFTAEEDFSGRKKNTKLGIGEKFIAVFSRDDAYYSKHLSRIYTAGTKIVDMNHIHSLYRNSNIKTLADAAELLQDQQLQFVRMGANVETEVAGDNIIDYAAKARSAFMDLYLLSQCRFFVADPCGIQFMALLFSKPIISINVILISGNKNTDIFTPSEVFIMKKFYNKNAGKFLPLREQLEFEVRMKGNLWTDLYSDYYQQGIIAIENTAEEIADVTREMQERLDGTAQYSAEDVVLQQKFRDLVGQYAQGDRIFFYGKARIGREFIRNNQWLLE